MLLVIPDYHQYHITKITEICQCCCSYLKPVWQGRLSYYNSPCWSWELSGSASFAFFLLFVGIKILQKTIISTWTNLLRFESTVVNFLDFQLWQQTEPLETALQRGQARKFPGNLTFTAQILSNVVSQMISECNQELFGMQSHFDQGKTRHVNCKMQT